MVEVFQNFFLFFWGVSMYVGTGLEPAPTYMCNFYYNNYQY